MPGTVPPMPASDRSRPRELGYATGRLPTAERNAIVDVAGVRVGHLTLWEDPPDAPAIRTGVTAVLPHGGNLYAEKVLGAVHVVNGYGKATGLTQLAELGTLESPILITNTLSVGPAWEGGLRHALAANPEAGLDSDTVNVVVGECFDGWLSDARGLHVRPEHALAAIEAARPDELGEGVVGAGTGTTTLGFKSGVGMASRRTLAEPVHTLGALVVPNYGRRSDLHLLLDSGAQPIPDAEAGPPSGGGSVIVVLATDAPLSERQLRRVAARATFGLGRAGSIAANVSGEYVLAFSTAHRVPHRRAGASHEDYRFVRDDSGTMRDLYEAAAEVTREAVLNALCVAAAVEGRDGHRAEAFPYELLRGLPRR